LSQPPTRCSSGSTSRTEAAEVELGEANEAGPRGTRVSGQGTYRLELTREQADRLLRLVSIAELAIVEHNRTGWLPTGQGDATLMRTYLKAGGPSLEQPMRELGAWIKQQERGRP